MLPPDRGTVQGSARAAVLSDWLTSWLGRPSSASIAKSYRSLAEAIEGGSVDVAWAPPAVCARVHEHARSILTIVRYGATACRAALVVRADSGIVSLPQLEKKRAAWVDPLSMNGHLMALTHMREEGLSPATLLSSQHFAGTYRDALSDVLDGRADVTSFYVVDEGTESTLRELTDILGPRARELTLLSMSRPAPYDALIVTKYAVGGVRLAKKLLSLKRKTRPPAMLLEVCRADRFVPGHIDDYARLPEFVRSFID